jgi:hypothetical protein
MRKLFLLGLFLATPALAWGGKGHRIIGELAVRNFPKAIPAFLRTPQAVAAIGELATHLREGAIPPPTRGCCPHSWLAPDCPTCGPPTPKQ